MSYLTLFRINPQRRGAQRLLRSPHALHAAVLAGFPVPSLRDEGRVLWRLDRNGPSCQLYIVSPDEPDLTHLVEQAGWPSIERWESRRYDPLLRRIDAGQRYAFRLTANPVHSVRVSPGARGKPLGHVTIAQQEQWLMSRQANDGFKVVGETGTPTFLVRDRRVLKFRGSTTNVTLSVATYEGLLTVTEPERFVHGLTHGIGRAKGYGCGLLTIAAAE